MKMSAPQRVVSGDQRPLALPAAPESERRRRCGGLRSSLSFELEQRAPEPHIPWAHRCPLAPPSRRRVNDCCVALQAGARVSRGAVRVRAQAVAALTKTPVTAPELEKGEMPLNTYNNKAPFIAKIKSVEKIVGPKATGETYHIVISTEGKIPFWEGQSYGVIPPVSSAAGSRAGGGRWWPRRPKGVGWSRLNLRSAPSAPWREGHTRARASAAATTAWRHVLLLPIGAGQEALREAKVARLGLP